MATTVASIANGMLFAAEERISEMLVLERRHVMVSIVIWIGLISFVSVLIVASWIRWRSARPGIDLEMAKKRFSERREWLEADFFSMGARSGSPRGLRWVECDFDNDACFAVDKRTGELTALVAVAIQFEAIEGEGMEDVEAVANQKAATAVFRFDGQHWQATGKTVFNLSPAETIQYFQNELETIEQR